MYFLNLPEKNLSLPVIIRQRIDGSESSCSTADANSSTNQGQRALKVSGRLSSNKPILEQRPLRDTFSPSYFGNVEKNLSPTSDTACK